MDPFNMLQVSILGIFRGVYVLPEFEPIPDSRSFQSKVVVKRWAVHQQRGWNYRLKKRICKRCTKNKKGLISWINVFSRQHLVFLCGQKVMVFQQLQAAAVAPLVVPAAAARYSLVGWALGAPGARWVRGDPGVTQVGNGTLMGFIVI